MKARRTLAALMAALALCTGAAAEENGGTTIIVATDLHYLSPALTDHGDYFTRMITNSDGKTMEYSEELTSAFVAQVIAAKPDALILSGDLTFNGARQSHLDLTEKLAQVTAAGIPVLAMPGNHDLDSANAASFEGDHYTPAANVGTAQFRKLYADFGFDRARAEDENSLSYVAELTPTLWVLMMDANAEAYPGIMLPMTYAWIEEQFEAAKQAGARILAVSHQNVLQHNSRFYAGFVMGNAPVLQEKYEQENVICNLSGHLHIQHIAQSENGLIEIDTSALAVSPNQYGVLTVTADTAEYHTERVDVSAWAAAQGSEAPDLLDFAAYSRRFFEETGVRQALRSLGEDENADALAAFFGAANADYFAGRIDRIDFTDARFALWKAQTASQAAYMAGLEDEAGQDYNTLAWSIARPSGETK